MATPEVLPIQVWPFEIGQSDQGLVILHPSGNHQFQSLLPIHQLPQSLEVFSSETLQDMNLLSPPRLPIQNEGKRFEIQPMWQSVYLTGFEKGLGNWARQSKTNEIDSNSSRLISH